MTPLQLAELYINHTHVSLFLTGKAGTGKTTFLHHIDAATPKRHVVLAPTGVAAINAGGVTIHSFFLLPLCPYLPDVKDLVTEYQMPDKRKHLRKERIRLIRSLELLIIDEISMVRADLLDAVDATLRRYRRNNRPFGGVQLLMIGDVQQLPPVVTDQERPYMEQVYPSPFFFHSKALQRVEYATIELSDVFRQQDAHFIGLLNNIRENRFDNLTLRELNARCDPRFDPPDSEGFIRLTTHNYQATAVNQRKLGQLKGRAFELDAVVHGNFPESSYPTDSHLSLKKGAQVMFVKNAADGSYYNGKIATVEGYDAEEGVAVVDKEGNHIVVRRERWENTRYEIDPDDNLIKPAVDGSFDQFPLKLAWAITVHKSQGLTFDKVIIDAASAFTYGQVYVALSRCRSLEGLVLSTPISAQCAFDNQDVLDFHNAFPPIEQVAGNFAAAQTRFFFDELYELFDCSPMQRYAERINALYQNHLRRIYPAIAGKMSELCNGVVADLVSVAQRFRQQLVSFERQCAGNINDPLLHERIRKGAAYFNSQTDLIYLTMAPLLEVEVDNKAVAQELQELSDLFLETVGLMRVCMRKVEQEDFSVEGYQKMKADFLLGQDRKAAKPSRSKKAKAKAAPVGGQVSHPELVELLRKWRKKRADAEGKPAFWIFSQKTLMALADSMPLTPRALLEVPGIGKTKAEQFGDELLDLFHDYAESQGFRH